MVIASLTLYSSSTQRGRARGVGSSSSICSATKKNRCVLILVWCFHPFLLLTDNIRERHLVFENVSDLSTSGKKRELYGKLDYCENKDGVALLGCPIDGRKRQASFERQ